MSSGKDGKAKTGKSKKERQLMKIIENSDGDDDSEHELSHYLNDRVKLMKQVLKIIKPKKIKSMAPDCMKNLDNGEINSMLLEELLGISNKRLKMIFAGQNVDEDTSSSTDPEAETKPIDIISLDDITDDDFIIEIDSSNEETGCGKKKHKKIKEEPPEKKIKKEKKDKSRKKNESEKPQEKSDEQNLMSVLELLELQARARAIRSQLALEATRKAQEAAQSATPVATITVKEVDESDGEDAVIVESPSLDEIVITSSESDNDDNSQDKDGESSKTQPSSSSNKTETNKNVQIEKTSTQLIDSSEIESSLKIGTEKASSHGTKTKESPRKHKGMCRKRMEKYKSMKEAENKLKESEVLESNSGNIEDSVNLLSDDNSDSVNKDKEKKDESQASVTQVETRQSEDNTKDVAMTVVNENIESKCDSEADKGLTENIDSHVERCSHDLQESTKATLAQKEPSSTEEEQYSVEEKPPSVQEEPSSIKKKSPRICKESSSIQEEDTKDFLLHSHQDGLVINIDDDDIDAINS